MSSIKPHGKGKTYWRSLDQVAQTPQFQEFLEKEFPAHASEWMGASRRGFLKIMAASFALAGLTSCRHWPQEKVAEYAHRPPNRSPGIPVHYATSMEIGGIGQGLVATSYDGRPIKVEGNPTHPLNMGATDLYAQASVLSVYDPDRARGVTQKGGASDWGKFASALKDIPADGAGLCILSEASGSPSVADMKQRLVEKRPKAQWFEYEAISDDASREGTTLAFGNAYRVVPNLDKAAVIVSIDADLFNSTVMGVKNTRDFANGRRLFVATDEKTGSTGAPPSMSRFYSIESLFTTTGACADHRLPVKPSQVPAVLYAIAGKLALPGLNLPAKDFGAVLGPGVTKFVKAIAEDINGKNKTGPSVFVAGARQSAEVHALVALLNMALGNAGKTVTYYADPNANRPTHVAALAELVKQINAGTVKSLVILGGNPVFDAPADVKFSDALAKVPFTVHVGQHEDETSERCGWHLAQTHYLEAWGDTQTFDGTLAIVQPLIEPMFDSKSTIEVLSLLADGAVTPGYDIVRRTLQDAGGLKTEWSWKQALYEGVIKGSTWEGATPPVKAGAIAAIADALAKPAAASEYEVVFYPSPSLYDGRFANNGWLQELPDPMSRLTWDNAAVMSPKTAASLGVTSDDLVTVTANGQSLDLSVFILVGQPDGVVGLALGYGHTRMGQIANGVGQNVYQLRTSTAMNSASAQIKPAGGRSELATVQDHHIIDPVGKNAYKRRVDEDIIKERTFAEFKAPEKAEPKSIALSVFDEHKFDGRVDGRSPSDVNYASLHKWGMSIDLTACTGCSACVVACQAENNIPIVGKAQVLHGREMHWLRIDRYFKASGEKQIGDAEADEIEGVHQVVLCMHCEEAPCEEVCPVGATTHSQEGLNMMTYNRCVGTRYCSNNCPYKVRRFNFFDYNNGDLSNLYTPNPIRPELGELQKMQKNPEVTVRMRGVMEKCTYCIQRIEGTRIIAKREGDRPIADGEIKTACQQVCPAGAIVFGDLNDVGSNVSKLHAQSRSYGLLDETLNTKPRTRYLEKIRNKNDTLVQET